MMVGDGGGVGQGSLRGRQPPRIGRGAGGAAPRGEVVGRVITFFPGGAPNRDPRYRNK